MKIAFFEEFPEREESLEKLENLQFPVRLVLGARDLSSFREHVEHYTSQSGFIQETVYWPMLSKSEGYWFSKLADPGAMQRVLKEFPACDHPIMLDLEFPAIFLPHFFYKELGYELFWRIAQNKGLEETIRESLDGKEVLTSEHRLGPLVFDYVFRFLGIRPSQDDFPHQKVIMAYSSLVAEKKGAGFLHVQCETALEQGIDKIAIGILNYGIGPFSWPKLEEYIRLLTPDVLARDLEILKRCGIQEAYIFRLGGLTKDHADVVKDYAC